MALQFKVYQREDRKSLGTIANIVGAGGSYRLASTANFLSGKRIVLVLQNAEGESETVTCSPAVSQALRDKSLRLSQVQGFEVCEFLTESGEISNTVVMPSAAAVDMPAVEVGGTYEAYQPVSRFKPEELVAL